MQTYTCPTCGEKMERDLTLFTEHTEKHIVDEVQRQNPAWVTKDGFCFKCLEYFKSQMRPDSSTGGTNIGPSGVRRRFVLGMLGYGAAIGTFFWLRSAHAPRPAWLVLFPLFFMGTLGFLQAKRKLCVVIAQKQEATMRKKAKNILIFSLILSGLLTAAGFMLSKTAFAATGTAVIQGTTPDSEVRGEAALIDTPEGLQISATFKNAPPGKHGFHIHENGACGDEGKAAGGHFNPMGTPHGLLTKDGFEHAHAGDFGNVEIGTDGTGKFEAVLKRLSLTEGDHAVGGKAFILHEKEDDFGQPTGNAGGRIGCGLIEVQN